MPETPSKRDDREEHARKPDRELPVAAGIAEQPDDPRGHDDEERRERGEDEQDEPEEARRDPPRAPPVPFSSSSVNTGTKADWSAASATRARTRFGTWNATVKALIFPAAPK